MRALAGKGSGKVTTALQISTLLNEFKHILTEVCIVIHISIRSYDLYIDYREKKLDYQYLKEHSLHIAQSVYILQALVC